MNLLPLGGLRLRLRLGDVLVEWITHNVEPLNQCIFFGCSWCLVPDLVDGLVNKKVEEKEKEKVRSSHFVSTELLWVSLNLSATLWFYSSVSNFTTFSVVFLLSPDADTESVITLTHKGCGDSLCTPAHLCTGCAIFTALSAWQQPNKDVPKLLCAWVGR